ncbi:hypothetical protein [Frigidibacter oleivorans]|uniref:hypothetical protein n=1 Tax=Frigidibacter oleivorans TaxID=2487129 RepID=UPI0013DEEC32|nr:hypothetical protein [Frigidibacter oleivorans]
MTKERRWLLNTLAAATREADTAHLPWQRGAAQPAPAVPADAVPATTGRIAARA